MHHFWTTLLAPALSSSDLILARHECCFSACLHLGDAPISIPDAGCMPLSCALRKLVLWGTRHVAPAACRACKRHIKGITVAFLHISGAVLGVCSNAWTLPCGTAMSALQSGFTMTTGWIVPHSDDFVGAWMTGQLYCSQ